MALSLSGALSGDDHEIKGSAVTHVGRWLWGLFVIAFFIRITQLTAKPAWMDEVSTVMFSLGNYSRLIPTDQLIGLDQITRGLQFTPSATVMDAATKLLAENNHPPAYFMLAHWWMDFFHGMSGQIAEGTYASLWASRAFPSFFGALAVPVAYWLGWVSFRDRLTGLLCAALMAFSPFSVFLSQEARHYTLAILLIMGSLGCFVLAVQAVRQQRPIRWLTVLAWIVINALGVAVHYFCGIAYCAQGLILLGLLVQQCLKDAAAWRRATWGRIYVVAAGTLAGVLVWLPVLLHFYGSPQTTYITSSSRDLNFWVRPLAQSLVGWLYALMSPISRGFSWQWVVVIVVTSVFLVLCYAPWLVFNLVRSLKLQWSEAKESDAEEQSLFRSGLLAMSGFFIVANLLYLAICYVVGFDITRGHRYTFAYYPSIVLLAGAGLAPFLTPKTTPKTTSKKTKLFSQVRFPFVKRAISGRSFVIMALLVAFLGTQTIVWNRTHLKFYMPDRFVDSMQAESDYPVILTMQAVSGSQPSVLGNEIVSVAWEIKRQLEKTTEAGAPDEWAGAPQFVLVEESRIRNNDPVETLKAAIDSAPRPFDLWSLSGSPDLTSIGCSEPERGNDGSFTSNHYVCK
ncbi:MAG: phospholipid carrier-dependent glycosyltransferase [Cyanobacteria bacterium J06621_11]